MPIDDEYDYDFDHPSYLACGDHMQIFTVVESNLEENEIHFRVVGEMEFMSQQQADEYCRFQERYGFFKYSAIPVEDEN